MSSPSASFLSILMAVCLCAIALAYPGLIIIVLVAVVFWMVVRRPLAWLFGAFDRHPFCGVALALVAVLVVGFTVDSARHGYPWTYSSKAAYRSARSRA